MINLHLNFPSNHIEDEKKKKNTRWKEIYNDIFFKKVSPLKEREKNPKQWLDCECIRSELYSYCFIKMYATSNPCFIPSDHDMSEGPNEKRSNYQWMNHAVQVKLQSIMF